MSKTQRARDVLYAPGVRTIARRLPLWRGLLVLVYHRIAGAAPAGPEGGVTSATQEALDEQMGFLARHADVVAPSEVPELLHARGRHVLVTFDDGYRDNYELAFPVLRRHGVRAAFFLATGFMDRPRVSWWDELGWMAAASREPSLPAGEWLDAPVPLADVPAAVRALTAAYKALPGERTEAFLDWCGEAAGTGRAEDSIAADLWMSWDMAREMRAGGMAFGGHTSNHPVLARLDRADQEREIAGCRQRLEDELGDPMTLFSYPVGLPGTFDADTRDCLRKNGVELAFSCYGGYVAPGRTDPYDLRRANVGRATDLKTLNAMTVSPRLFARW